MSKITSRILKADSFEISGIYKITLTGSQGTPASGPVPSQPQFQPEANVVERHPEYAVIEITCSCGSKMYVRCDYAQTPAPEPAEVAQAD